MLRITVGHSGEDYFSIQEAINAVPYEESAQIIISEGIYKEKLFSEKKNLSIRGEGKVYIYNAESAHEIVAPGIKRGTFRSYTAFFGGEHVELSNLTIVNGAGSGDDVEQAVALYLDADEALIKNVRLLSYQDTLFISPLPDTERMPKGFYGPRYLSARKRTRSVFQNCYIEGSVDFIFGGGDALFVDSEIVSNEPGYVTAPSGKKDWIGLVFYRSSFEAKGKIEGDVYLMRPWRPEGKTTLIGCKIGDHVRKELYTTWNGEEDNSTFLVLEEDSKEALDILGFFK